MGSFRLVMVLILGLLLLGPQVVVAANSPAMELVERSGLSSQVRHYPELIRQGMRQADRPGAPQLPAGLRRQFVQLVGEAYDPLNIISQVLRDIEQGLATEEIALLLSWLDSSLGRKVTELERRSSEPETQARMRELGQQLGSSEVPKARGALLQRMDDAIHATEMTVELVVNTQVAVATAMMGAFAVPDQVPAEQIRANVERSRMQLRGILGQQMFISLYYTYLDLDDSELLDYVQFAESPLGRKYHRVVSGALATALLKASHRFGEAVGQLLQQQQMQMAG